jgi:hypothetical protein
VSTELQRIEEDDGSETDEILLRELLAEEKRCTGSLLEIWIRTGEILIARREKCPHGTWRPWLKAHTNYSHDTARIYIEIAKNKDRILALPKDEPIRLLSDAYILATEDDPEAREALLKESKDTGKSLRVTVNKRKKAAANKAKERVEKSPKERSRSLRQDAVQSFYRQWTQRSRTLLPDGEALEWVNKVPVTKGETALTIGKEAYRLREASLSVPPSELSADVLAPEPPNEPKEAPTADPVGPAEPLVPVVQPSAAPEVVSESQTAVQALNKQSFALKDYIDLITSGQAPLWSLEWAFDAFYRALMTVNHLSFGDRDLLHEHIRKATESKYP